MRARPRLAMISAATEAGLAVVGLSIHAPTASSERFQAEAQVISNIAYAPAQPTGSQGHLLDLCLPDGGYNDPILTGGTTTFGAVCANG
ncbi:hypothetical protein LZG04_27515 [Saccharothrix sp. S26]|uniref:hypothetical protein n=1 Tax=Saccharothrix sp. S26 TaxID=2907215 RepID=UPI001F39DF73|nr:hypothetical protein [Saccharothrix sp. S26]MCE6998521.1 hypothetical protein [Saccharothrix sp. S26]